MIFKDLLDQHTRIIRPLFDTLHHLAGENQSHGGDLLLVHQNASYREEVLTWDNIPERLSPYTIGTGETGHSALTHHSFIGEYLSKELSSITLQEYLTKFNDKSSRGKIEVLEKDESYTIQSEMLIYLKIWESDTVIKEFYQITRLVLAEPFDWHFKVSTYARDNTATGTRESILRLMIRDRLKELIPGLYDLLKEIYIPQLRNAIAHSQYFIYGRSISLTNYDANNPFSQIKSIKFDEWIRIFHKSLVLYTELTRILNQVHVNYSLMAEREGSCQIRVSKEIPNNETEYRELYYDKVWDTWNWEKE